MILTAAILANNTNLTQTHKLVICDLNQYTEIAVHFSISLMTGIAIIMFK